MNIYLAASYERKVEMRQNEQQLIKLGHKVVSSWLCQDFVFDDAATPKEKTACAKNDLLDILLCDTFILFSGGNGKGGRHVELGVAIAEGKKIVLVGERENVFHYLENITVYDTWERCVEAL